MWYLSIESGESDTDHTKKKLEDHKRNLVSNIESGENNTWFFTQITVIKRPSVAECCIHLPRIVLIHNA